MSDIYNVSIIYFKAINIKKMKKTLKILRKHLTSDKKPAIICVQQTMDLEFKS